MDRSTQPARGCLAACYLLLALNIGCDNPISDASSDAMTQLTDPQSETRAQEDAFHALATRADAVVVDGASIQAAIDAAAPGGTIVLRPGTYRESITIDKPNLTLIGLGGPAGNEVILENPGGAPRTASTSPPTEMA